MSSDSELNRLTIKLAKRVNPVKDGEELKLHITVGM